MNLYNPVLTPAQMRTVLTNSCIDIMGAGWDRDYGSGILMALAALQTPRPRIISFPGSMKYSKPGQFQATLGGLAGSNYNIFVSTNLTTRSTLTAIRMTNADSIFTDTTATQTRRFYRAELSP